MSDRRTVLDMNRYQWTVLFAAWLGWGFDVFDGLLFNYVAPNCVPTLLGLPIGSPQAASGVPSGISSSVGTQLGATKLKSRPSKMSKPQPSQAAAKTVHW